MKTQWRHPTYPFTLLVGQLHPNCIRTTSDCNASNKSNTPSKNRNQTRNQAKSVSISHSTSDSASESIAKWFLYLTISHDISPAVTHNSTVSRFVLICWSHFVFSLFVYSLNYCKKRDSPKNDYFKAAKVGLVNYCKNPQFDPCEWCAICSTV